MCDSIWCFWFVFGFWFGSTAAAAAAIAAAATTNTECQCCFTSTTTCAILFANGESVDKGFSYDGSIPNTWPVAGSEFC
eukprot:6039854-Amphidinium_carterae.1